MYALANDNWIGRLPFAYAPGGRPLGQMTVKTLARGRMCVNKIIAEPERPGARNTRQGGLRGNTISFPQARLELNHSKELPAPLEEGARFMSNSVVIALAGADKEDLHNAKWAEIPRQDYVDAATFATSHGMAYNDMVVNASRAHSLFAPSGRTSEAVLQQAVPVVGAGELQHRLEGPADTGHAGHTHEQCVNIDGEEVAEEITEEEETADFNASLPDEEFPEAALPTMNFCADSLTSGDMDEIQAIRKVYAEMEELRKAVVEDAAGEAEGPGPARAQARSLQRAARDLLPRRFTTRIMDASGQTETMEGEHAHGQGLPHEAYAVHTGSEPLSMYAGPTWAMCFPVCFPYGDGVFGLPRAKNLTFQQCAAMQFLREELSYQVGHKVIAEAKLRYSLPLSNGESRSKATSPACPCQQCVRACEPFVVSTQARWGQDRELICCNYDSWRRMEQIRRAKAHVQRHGYRQKLERICNASAEKIEAAIRCVGQKSNVRDVLRSSDCDQDLKEALAELMVFTTEVVGTDGARAKLRHEQNGFALAFGASGGFLTPNLADVRSPLVVTLHGGGTEERYEVNLADEISKMPSAREMLQVIAEDPVAQARFFIISMRLFCEHVLGAGPFDDVLRHNGWLEGSAFPDGFAASGLGGAFGMIAAFHGPVEEQARLSIHPHILLWFTSSTSQAWLRNILRHNTEEAQLLLRGWQEKVLAVVQSTQLDSAAVLPLLLDDTPEQVAPPRSTPFSEKQREYCRFDGKIEGDAKDETKRRPLVATENLFVDHHLRDYSASFPEGVQGKSEHLIPLTGAQLSRMPLYRLLQPMTLRMPITKGELYNEAVLWRNAFAEDYRSNISVSQMHMHKDTCFKYVVQNGVRKAKHCRFHFNHFVKLAVKSIVDGIAKVRDCVLARTGKGLVLPRTPGEPEMSLVQYDVATGDQIALKPTAALGPTVIIDDKCGKLGRVSPIRWNPLEGSSNGPAQVATRGNMDYQSMLRTFISGFGPQGWRDELRDPLPTEDEILEQRQHEQELSELGLPEEIKKIMAERRQRGLPVRAPEDIELELRGRLEAKQRVARRGERLGDRLLAFSKLRFKKWVRSIHVEDMMASIATMFYACDYSTKPNMLCSSVLVAFRDGVARLEKQMQEEQAHDESTQPTETTPDHHHVASTAGGVRSRRGPTPLEREASRRLIRLSNAAHNAQVKGNCLMIMQMLTRREVIRSHQPWQLMMKHAMWMAFEHRRFVEGLAAQDLMDPVPITILEGRVEEKLEDDDGELASNGSSHSDCDMQDVRNNVRQEGELLEAQVGSEGNANMQVADAVDPPTRVTFRRKTDTFYDDYLHRGSSEYVNESTNVESPLAPMNYMEYGTFVRVVPGDPWALRDNQYAFDDHHDKFETHVQEVRVSPTVPYVHGFTMPTQEKDVETNACFKQVLLRPHRCRGPGFCNAVNAMAATAEFLEKRVVRKRRVDRHGIPEDDDLGRPMYIRGYTSSYVWPWKRFEAFQISMAEAADRKVATGLQLPVLQDTQCMRAW